MNKKLLSLLVIVVCALLWLWPRTAHASGWYYAVSCTGACYDFFEYPDGQSNSFSEGPFSSEESCLSDRAGEVERREVLSFSESDGWYIGACYWVGDFTEDSANKDKRSPLVSMLRASYVAGAGWTIEESNSPAQRGESTQGIELELYMGRSSLRVESTIGIYLSQFSSLFGPEPARIPFVPVAIGLSASPAALYRGDKIEVRPRLGAALSSVSTWGCHFVTSCTPTFQGLTSELGARFTLGVDVFFGEEAAPGIGLDLLFPLERLGELDDLVEPTLMEAHSPLLLARLSVMLRAAPD